MSASLEIFRALADPTRLRIVALLRKMELSVGELAQVLGQSQPRVSRHVKILCDAGIAIRRKEGSWAFLAPGVPQRVDPLFRALDQWQPLDGDNHWAIADSARLAAVHADRAVAAERYFAAHAAQWDAIRCPALVLRGAQSDLLTRETCKQMAQRGPKAKVVEIAGVGHAPTLLHGDQIRIVREFLLA